jgi:hypothetical protein
VGHPSIEDYRNSLEQALSKAEEPTALTLAIWWRDASADADRLEGLQATQAGWGRDMLAVKLSEIALRPSQADEDPRIAKARFQVEKCLTDMSFTPPWGAKVKMDRWHNMMEAVLDTLDPSRVK